MGWDRSKQTYFILRRGNAWSVMTADMTRKVCDIQNICTSHTLIDGICFAENDKKVLALMENYYWDHPEKRPYGTQNDQRPVDAKGPDDQHLQQ